MKIAEAFVDIVGETSTLKKDLRGAEKDTKKSVKKMDKEIETVGDAWEAAGDQVSDFAATTRRAAAGAIAALAGIATGGGYLVKVASDANELQNLVSESFGQMSDDINEWADNTGDKLSRSTDDMLNFAGTLQAMLGPMIGNREEAAEMSTRLSELAVNLGSYFNISDNRALQKLRSGLSGQSEAVRELGIDISQAALEQELMNQGIEKSYQELSQAEKVQMRYNIILQDTVDAHNDAADTSDSLQNMYKALKAEVHDAAVEYGDNLIPAAKEFVSTATDIIAKIGNLDEETQNAIIQFVGMTSAVLGGVVALGLLATASEIAVTGLGLIAGVASFLASPLVLAAIGAGLLWAAFDKNWLGIGDAFEKIKNKIKQMTGIDFSKINVDAALAELNKLKDWFKETDFYTASKKSFKDIQKSWKENGLSLDFGIDFTAAIGDAAKGFQSTLKNLQGGLEKIRNSSAESFGDINFKENLQSQLSEGEQAAISDLMQIGKNIASVLQTGLKIGLEGILIIDTIAEIALQETFKPFLEVGSKIVGKIIDGIKQTGDNLKNTVLGMLPTKASIKLKLSNIEWLQWLKDKAKNGLEIAVDFIKGIGEDKNDDPEIGKTTEQKFKSGEIETTKDTKLESADDKTWVPAWFSTGGIVQAATGGYISGEGGPTSDSIPAMLSDGEYVIRASEAQKWMPLLQAINSGNMQGFAQGGSVGTPSFAGMNFDNVSGFLDGIKSSLSSVTDTLQNAITAFAKGLITVVDVVGEAFGKEGLGDKLQSALENLGFDFDTGSSKTEKGGADAGETQPAELGDVPEKLEQSSKTFIDRVKEAGEFFKNVGEGVFDSLKSSVMQNNVVQAGMQGFQSGGITGAITGVISQSKGFKSVMEAISPTLQSLANSFGAILEPLVLLINLLGNILVPIFNAFGGILKAVITPAVKILSGVLRAVGIVVLTIAKGILDAWNFIAKGIEGFLNGIIGLINNLPFVDIGKVSLQVDTGDIEKSLEDLKSNTDKNEENEENTEKIAESMSNAPSGFKAALTRFNVAQPANLDVGGTIMSDGIAKVHEGEVIMNEGQQAAASGGQQIVVQGDVYGYDDFSEKVNTAREQGKRQSNIRSGGNPVSSAPRYNG